MKNYSRKQLIEAIRYWEAQLRMLDECDGGGMDAGPADMGGDVGPADMGGFGPSGGDCCHHAPPPPTPMRPFGGYGVGLGYGFPYPARGFGIYGMNPYSRLGGYAGYGSSSTSKKKKKKTSKKKKSTKKKKK